MFRSKRSLPGLLLGLALGMAHAALPEMPRPRTLGVEDGLPSSSISGIAQDRAGYLWLATNDGLARYDGVGMRVWQHEPGKAGSLPGNYVSVVHVDGRDRVWVAVESRGLAMLDPSRGDFRQYRKASHPGMASDDVWAIASRDDELWFGTYGGGLHRLRADGRIERFMPVEGDANSLPADTVLALRVAADGGLWVGTTEGLARWNGRGFERIALPGAEPAATVFSISVEGDGLWVGAASGLFRRDARGQWSQPAWSAMFARPNQVYEVVPDAGGALWLASPRNLWRALPGQVPYPVPIGTQGPTAPMLQMLRQRDGALWFPVSGVGLGYLRPGWRGVAEFTRERGGLASDMYFALAPSRAGGTWLAGSRGAVEHVDAKGEVTRLGGAVEAELEGARLFAIAEDYDGRLWVSDRRGLVRLEADRSVRRWGAEDAADATPGGPIDLIAIAPDGSVWLSSSGAGIQQRDARSGKVLIHIAPGPAQGLGVGDSEAIAFDGDGVPWVAGGQGVARWDAATGRLQAVPGIDIDDRVHALAFDGADVLWLQRLPGLERYRRVAGRWRFEERVGAAQGIPGVEGSALRVDARHRVWLSSLRGLYRWDPQHRRTRRFGMPSGLSSQEFVDRAMALAANGTLAATLADGGVVLVDTRAPDPSSVTSPLQLDRVEVFRDGAWRLLAGGAVPALLSGDRDLRVQLRLLAFGDPANNRYRTRLEGYDRDWVDQGNSGDRSFSGLAPGEYVLHARASDGAGNAAAERAFRFSVQPPWWRTGAAALGFSGLALLLLWMLGDAYCTRLARRNAWRLAQHERELAQQASLAKTRFLATLGHEVRTPMTGVMGMSELLLDTPLDATQRGYTESIQRAGEHLLRLVNDALDLARIESGKLELEDARFDLHTQVNDVVALMAPLARKRGLAFDAQVDGDVPAGVRGDAKRVSQILMNLLGNAIKFTEHGRVSLRVSRVDGANFDGVISDGVIQFEVADTGPGLNDEQKSRLFRRFEQAEGARTAARYGGSGLGLAICQELVAEMGGQISVESTPGAGSRFVVALPLPPAVLVVGAGTAQASPRAGGRALSLLLVEDEPTVAEVIVGLLSAQGHRVVHVAHGLAALTEVMAGSFDVAILDLDLPGVDGLTLARQLRLQGFVRPLLALTARADRDAEADAADAGFDRFLRKPVTGAMLADVLAAAVETNTPKVLAEAEVD